MDGASKPTGQYSLRLPQPIPASTRLSLSTNLWASLDIHHGTTIDANVLAIDKTGLLAAEKKHGNILEKSHRELTAQNTSRVIRKRLEHIGVNKELAREAARADV